MLGLELRKKNDLENLYADVDRILGSQGIGKNEITADTQNQAVSHALHKMLKADQFLDICAIDNCIKVSQIVVSTERYDVYYSLHCINWSDMLPNFRQTVICMILDDFRVILNPNNETTSIYQI